MFINKRCFFDCLRVCCELATAVLTRLCLQDIPENAADIAHLGHLHKPVVGSDVEKTNDSVLNNMIQHGIKVLLELAEQ